MIKRTETSCTGEVEPVSSVDDMGLCLSTARVPKDWSSRASVEILQTELQGKVDAGQKPRKLGTWEPEQVCGTGGSPGTVRRLRKGC